MKSNQYPLLVVLVLMLSAACGVAEGPIEYSGPGVEAGSVLKRLDAPVGGDGSVGADDVTGEGGQAP